MSEILAGHDVIAEYDGRGQLVALSYGVSWRASPEGRPLKGHERVTDLDGHGGVISIEDRVNWSASEGA